jgi:hypothetical protein
LVGRHKGKRPLGRPRRRWGYIKTDLQEVWLGGLNWIDLAQDRVLVAGSCQRGDEPTGSIKCREFLD